MEASGVHRQEALTRQAVCHASPLAYIIGPHGFLKEASTCRIEAPADICIEYPWTTILAAHSRVDRCNGIHRAAPRSESIGVRFKTCLPFWFQGRFDDGLHHPVPSGRYA